jgi:pilus assembly protein CpaF
MNVREVKTKMRQELRRLFTVDDRKVDRDYLRERMNEIFYLWKKDRKIEVADEVKAKVIKQLTDDFIGYGPISEFLDDPETTEIMVNGPNQIYVEKRGRKYLSDVKFDDYMHLRYIIERMISPSGRRVDESSPYADFSLPDGSRVNIVIPPLSVDGPIITIRKLLYEINDLDNLINLKTLDKRMASFLKACVKARLNIIFSGATGSGKTTSLEVLSSYINKDERIVTIEDALEIKMRQNHVVRLLSRPPNIDGKGEVTIRDLFINSLRMRPSRIILGEIRGAEAMDYLQALNSGHRGCLAVLHAATPEDAITRIETMALYSGLNLPTWAIRKQIASGLNIIVQQEQLIDGSRKINYITEVAGLRDSDIVLRDLFKYKIDEVDENNNVKGRFVAVNKPTFLDIFKERGISFNEQIFKEQS